MNRRCLIIYILNKSTCRAHIYLLGDGKVSDFAEDEYHGLSDIAGELLEDLVLHGEGVAFLVEGGEAESFLAAALLDARTVPHALLVLLGERQHRGRRRIGVVIVA